MKPAPTLLAAIVATAGLGMAAPSAPAPAKSDDTAALQRAIDAVDGAKKAAGSTADPKTPAAPANKPAREAPGSAKPTPKPAKPEVPRTKITSEEDGIFKNKEGIAVFRRNVMVDRSDLKIWCDELEVTLDRPDAKKPAEPPPPKDKDEASDDAFSAKNMKKAVAKAAAGGVVVIVRKTEKGEMVANCHEAVYDGATGNIVLKGRPEVLQDLQKFIVGKDDAATLTMLKNGDVTGRVGFEFVQEAKGREYRRRLLSSIPGKRASDIDPIDPIATEGTGAKASPTPPDKTN